MQVNLPTSVMCNELTVICLAIAKVQGDWPGVRILVPRSGMKNLSPQLTWTWDEEYFFLIELPIKAIYQPDLYWYIGPLRTCLNLHL